MYCGALWAVVAHVTLPGIGNTGCSITEIASGTVSSGSGELVGLTVFTQTAGEGLTAASWTVVSYTKRQNPIEISPSLITK